MAESDTCFVLMPFGRKANPFPGPCQINFDNVYEKVIVPAVKRAGLEPLRADQEISGGLIHLAMFERLLLCKYAVADLTTANPNVYYELGIRHAVRPWSTVLLCEKRSRLPFDVGDLRAYMYSIDDNGELSNSDDDVGEIGRRLDDVKKKVEKDDEVTQDSPLFTLLTGHGYAGPDLTQLEAKMNDRAEFCKELETVRNVSGGKAVEMLQEIQKKYLPGTIDNAPVLFELFMAYRRVAAWKEMVALLGQMPPCLRKSVSVQEQYGMALGRLGDFDGAEEVLNGLIDKRGPTALTFCFLGVVRELRLLKVRENVKAGEKSENVEVQGALINAIEAFRAAFKLDPRMIFAGINAVALMDVKDPSDQELKDILPVVRYFIHDAVDSGKAAFWEHSAALEMSVLDNDKDRAAKALDLLKSDEHEPWMPVSALAILSLIREHREKRGAGQPWYLEVEDALQRLSQKTQPV